MTDPTVPLRGVKPQVTGSEKRGLALLGPGFFRGLETILERLRTTQAFIPLRAWTAAYCKIGWVPISKINSAVDRNRLSERRTRRRNERRWQQFTTGVDHGIMGG